MSNHFLSNLTIMHSTRSVIVSLACLLLTLWLPQLYASPIEISAESTLNLAGQVEWCASEPSTEIAQIAQGACQFKPTQESDFAQGFSAKAFWLRMTLQNSSDEKIDRRLKIGHPRLQWVSLFEPLSVDAWQRIDTGTRIPVNQRNVIEAYPVLPLTFEAGEIRTLYVRVLSESSIDLRPTFWSDKAYARAHQSYEVFEMLTIGGLFMAVIFTLIVFYFWREQTYLLFAAALVSEIILDTSYNGLLPVYFWPENLPFDIRIQAVSIAATVISFVLFIRKLMGSMTHYRAYDIGMLTATVVMLLATLWACLVNYGQGIPIVSLAVLFVPLIAMAIFFKAWRNGFRPAAFMLLSYGILAVAMFYRIAVSFGITGFSVAPVIGYSFAFLLITPTILIAIAQNSLTLRESLLKTQADTSARIKFLAQMSHEFRTPLNTMLGYADMLERNSKRVSVAEAFRAIKQSGRHLLGMIDEILDHSRGEAGKLSLNLAPVNCAEFMATLAHDSTMIVNTRGNQFQLNIEGSLPTALLLDERRLRQVLDNLISNADRYTSKGVITLTCSAHKVSGERYRWHFSVSDTGAGIAQNELQLIFQPFSRGTSGRASGIDGTGMGLAIVRQLVDLMGGEVKVESLLAVGSQFSFSIECVLAEVLTNIQPQKWERLSKSFCLLVVDDDADNVALLSILLKDCDFKVVSAYSGNAARQYLNDSIDLVITDQFMQDGDGWSVLTDWSARKVPVILLSAATPQRPVNFPKELDFVETMLKPFEAKRLLNSLTEMLKIEWLPVSDEVISTALTQPIRPPLHSVLPLHKMIEEGAVTDIKMWIKNFSELHPEYTAYCEELASANLALDFHLLRKLIS